MKKKWASLCWLVSACLTIGFVAKTIRDWHVYTSILNSAPFRLWVLFNGIMFLGPAAILLLVGFFLNKRPK